MKLDYHVKGLDGEQSAATLPIAMAGLLAGASLAGSAIVETKADVVGSSIVWEWSHIGVSRLYSMRPAFRSEAESVEFASRTELGRRLRAIRARIVASGAELMDWDQISAEVVRRRGEAS